MTRFLFVLVLAVATNAYFPTAQDKPASGDNQLQRADQLVQAHQLEKASELLTEILEKDPDNETAIIKLGQIQLALGLYEDALKSFESILTNKPHVQDARDGEVKAAEANALADQKAGIDGSALMCLIRARKFVPDSPQLLLDFGMQAERMRIYRDADEALTKAHELAPQDVKILYALSHVQLDEQKMPEAEANLRAYLAQRPQDATAHYGLGHLLHVLLKEDEARVELERSIALQPRQSASYYELGEIALEQNHDDDARREYMKTLEMAPHHGGALTGLGVLEFRAKDYITAEKYLKSAIQYAAEYPRAHHYYSLVLMRLGRTDEAKRESELATELDKQETKASHGNAMTLVQ
ncbi:tetratricopeptide repeat protein [Telmatobacter sp. DSM 110680]|uniref:Tetratricopeptide repeat protein n=1 Tax=Telmatobacter sp. DSM 110680 TaxID=3036704 RepID=A0AAU7DIP9_9BACT